jgi:predicted  nucleic acid-binding Zn-ribbon protein
MTNKIVNGECDSCESSYSVSYMEEIVSSEIPEHCPFCGEIIEELSEEYIEEDDSNDDETEWD